MFLRKIWQPYNARAAWFVVIWYACCTEQQLPACHRFVSVVDDVLWRRRIFILQRCCQLRQFAFFVDAIAPFCLSICFLIRRFWILDPE